MTQHWRAVLPAAPTPSWEYTISLGAAEHRAQHPPPSRCRPCCAAHATRTAAAPAVAILPQIAVPSPLLTVLCAPRTSRALSSHSSPQQGTGTGVQVAVGIFLHSAFPSSEIFRAFPKREELLRSLLNADVIGFHTFDYARHFISCCSRMLGLEHYTKRGSILMNYYGRSVHLKILPTCAPPPLPVPTPPVFAARCHLHSTTIHRCAVCAPLNAGAGAHPSSLCAESARFAAPRPDGG